MTAKASGETPGPSRCSGFCWGLAPDGGKHHQLAGVVVAVGGHVDAHAAGAAGEGGDLAGAANPADPWGAALVGECAAAIYACVEPCALASAERARERVRDGGGEATNLNVHEVFERLADGAAGALDGERADASRQTAEQRAVVGAGFWGCDLDVTRYCAVNKDRALC